MGTITIGSNIGALRAQRSLNAAQNGAGAAFERLSSGQRINRASDDAAGLAIASSLGADTRIFTQGLRNLNDGISALSIASGALENGMVILDRLRELASQSANGSFSLVQRRSLSAEADALISEFNRMTATADFNGLKLLDGRLRQIVLQGGRGPGSTLSLNLSSSLNRTVGDGTYTSRSVSFGSTPNRGDAGDLNGDGIDDLVIADAVNTRIMFGQSNGTFVTTTVAPGGSDARVADLNGDGQADILVQDFGTGVAQILLGDGSGNFNSGVSVGFAAGFGSMAAIRDVDGDGDADLIGSLAAGGFGYMRNDGNGGYAAVTLSSEQFYDPAVGDFNGDGQVDLVARSSSQDQLQIFNGSGTGNFSLSHTVPFYEFSSGEFAIGDFDRDGFDDIVVQSSETNQQIYRGGQNGFTLGAVLSNPNMESVRAADFNGDGFVDLVVQGYSSSAFASVLLNDGSGQFTESFDSGAILGDDGELLEGDFNGDGALDFISWETDTGGFQLFSGRGTEVTSLSYLNLLDVEGSRAALDTLDVFASRIQRTLGDIGASESRASTAIANLAAARENYAAARSRIIDVDVASESALLTRSQILAQVAASVLAQANQAPALALRLLNVG